MASMFSHGTAKNALSWKRRDNEPGAQPSSLDMAFSVRQPNPDLAIALDAIVVSVSAHAGKCRRRSEDWLVHVAEIAELFCCCCCFCLCFVHLVSCWIPRNLERNPLTRSEPEKVRTSAGFGRSFSPSLFFSASTVAVCLAVLFSLYVRFFLLFSLCQ
jgi:hypothetical protein